MAQLVRWLVLLAAFARPPAPRDSFKYFTQLGDQVLNQVDAVLYGKVVAVTAMPGTDVVRLSISTWYLGDRKEGQDQVTLLASRGDFFEGTEQLLFLKKYEGGPRYTLHNRVAKSDPDFEAKRHVLEATLALR